MSWIAIVVGLAFANNVVLDLLLGVDQGIERSDRLGAALSLGVWVALLATLAALLTWVAAHLLLAPLGVPFLQTVLFVLIIAALVLALEAVLSWLSRASRLSRGLERLIVPLVPLLTVNSAVFGVTLIAVRADYSLLGSALAGVGAGAGALIALVLLSTIRDRLSEQKIPRAFEGLPIIIITLGLLALAFAAFGNGLLGGPWGR